MARIDLIRDNNTNWVLNELELVEPGLFFRRAPEAGEKFANHIMDILEGKTVKRSEDFGFTVKAKPFAAT